MMTMKFRDYLMERLKDAEFRREYEAVEAEAEKPELQEEYQPRAERELEYAL